MCPLLKPHSHQKPNVTGDVCIPTSYVCDGVQDCPIDLPRNPYSSKSHSVDEASCQQCALGTVRKTFFIFAITFLHDGVM